MFDPLKVAKNRQLFLQLQYHHTKEYFTCTKLDNILSTQPKRSIARYTLSNIKTEQELTIEVIKDRGSNFHIYLYTLLEQKPFSNTFYTLLGLDSIGYMANKEAHAKHTLYQRITHPNEEIAIIKYICDTEDLPAHPALLGYEKDGQGNWYMLLQQSLGKLKRLSSNKQIRSWEYKSLLEERLLIEIEESKPKAQRAFQIYQGRKLSRKNITLLSMDSLTPNARPTTPEVMKQLQYKASIQP